MRLTSPVTLLLTLLLAGPAAGGPLALVQQLRIDNAALVAAERDFRLQRERGTLHGSDATDYAAYIARLHRRVAEDCVTLARSGYPVPADLPCPDNRMLVVRSAPIDQAAEQTGSEQIAALDAELNSGLGEFDELLLREQQRVKAATPRREDSGAGGGGGQGDGEDAADGAGDYAGGATGEGDDSGDSDPQRTGAGGGRQGSGGAGGGPGRPGQRVPGGQPPDIPDGSDDDVVARQLREAAEKETDPELKKKLWEEYRKYKQGTR